jgi:hypothetical protein
MFLASRACRSLGPIALDAFARLAATALLSCRSGLRNFGGIRPRIIPSSGLNPEKGSRSSLKRRNFPSQGMCIANAHMVNTSLLMKPRLKDPDWGLWDWLGLRRAGINQSNCAVRRNAGGFRRRIEVYAALLESGVDLRSCLKSELARDTEHARVQVRRRRQPAVAQCGVVDG